MEMSITKCEVYEFKDAEDGNTYLWNATLGRALAESRPDALGYFELEDTGITLENIFEFCPDLDTEKADNMPFDVLLFPLLFVRHREKSVLIDGWHRLYKALCLCIPRLSAYVLTQEEADSIQIHRNSRQK